MAPTYTFEEYLALERTLEERYEFHDGVMVCMSGGKEPHARLGARMTSLLDRLFPDCRVYGDNLRVRIEAVNHGFILTRKCCAANRCFGMAKRM